MPKHHIVRAREHHGTNSLDLTVPASICEEFGIKVGDAFGIAAEETDELSLTYKRLYRQKTRASISGC